MAYSGVSPKPGDGRISAAASSDDRCKGGCSLGHPFDPVTIPHDIENRGVATRIDQERNPQVSGAFQRSPQVTGSARLNLSRWRHGFEPRWDYQETRRSGVLSGLASRAARSLVPHSSRSGPHHVTQWRGRCPGQRRRCQVALWLMPKSSLTCPSGQAASHASPWPDDQPPVCAREVDAQGMRTGRKHDDHGGLPGTR